MLPDYLPWAALIGPGIVLQKDALVQKTIAFRGPDLASSSEPEFVSTIARINNALLRLASGWSLFVEAQRFQSNHYPDSVFPSPAAAIVDLERKRTFEAYPGTSKGNRWTNMPSMTFIVRAPLVSGHRLRPPVHPICADAKQGAPEARATAMLRSEVRGGCEGACPSMQS